MSGGSIQDGDYADLSGSLQPGERPPTPEMRHFKLSAPQQPSRARLHHPGSHPRDGPPRQHTTQSSGRTDRPAKRHFSPQLRAPGMEPGRNDRYRMPQLFQATYRFEGDVTDSTSPEHGTNAVEDPGLVGGAVHGRRGDNELGPVPFGRI